MYEGSALLIIYATVVNNLQETRWETHRLIGKHPMGNWIGGSIRGVGHGSRALLLTIRQLTASQLIAAWLVAICCLKVTSTLKHVWPNTGDHIATLKDVPVPFLPRCRSGVVSKDVPVGISIVCSGTLISMFLMDAFVLFCKYGTSISTFDEPRIF